MGYKFSFVCNYELVGFCMDIVGLNADTVVEYNNFKYHKIELIDFHLCDQYLKYLKESKDILCQSCIINVLDNEGISIGEYSVYVEKYLKYDELKEIREHQNLTLICSLNYVAVGNEVKLWDKWRCSKPNKTNEWATLNDEDRKAWLNVVMKYHFGYKRSYYDPYENISGETYYLDGRNITTFESFFCALGEAINGPGGYYGFDESNILDCLTGGFRVCHPFKLVWKNSTVALMNLTKQEWENQIKREKERYSRIFEDYPDSKPNQSFFSKIIVIFLDHGITLELVP